VARLMQDHACVNSPGRRRLIYCYINTYNQQIPSCTYPVVEANITHDYGVVADNLRTLCELAQRYGITVAYEAPAWGIHVNRWQQTRDIASLVNVSNMKLCLDTYHIATKEVGDPFNTLSPVCQNQLSCFNNSLEELRATVKPTDIGYFQLSDATVADPEQKGYPVPDLDQPPFMTQSRNCRMFPCEPAKYGGTLPALEVAKAVFATRYDGWVSMEVFHTDLYDSRST
jgi:4-hydroxyphenylpyruvate dioxygenase